MHLYIDESGGIHGRDSDVLLVTGIVLAEPQFKQFRRRMKKVAEGTPNGEKKGADMNVQEQLSLLKTCAGAPAAAVLVNGCMPRTSAYRGALQGEPPIYAAMIAELICAPQFVDLPISGILADTGRYSASEMRALPARIAQMLTYLAPHRTFRRVQFVESYSSPGVQAADVTSNFCFRHVRSPGSVPCQVFAQHPGGQQLVIEVATGHLEALTEPTWITTALPAHHQTTQYVVPK